MSGIFPFVDGSVIKILTTSTLPIPKEYAWDFNRDDFILKNGKCVIVEGLEAIKIWIYKALKTARYRYLAYTWNYGTEYEKLIGNGKLTNKALQSYTKQMTEDALLVNPYIKSIDNFNAIITNDTVTLNFNAKTDYGEVRIVV